MIVMDDDNDGCGMLMLMDCHDGGIGSSSGGGDDGGGRW